MGYLQVRRRAWRGTGGGRLAGGEDRVEERGYLGVGRDPLHELFLGERLGRLQVEGLKRVLHDAFDNRAVRRQCLLRHRRVVLRLYLELDQPRVDTQPGFLTHIELLLHAMQLFFRPPANNVKSKPKTGLTASLLTPSPNNCNGTYAASGCTSDFPADFGKSFQRDSASGGT